MFMLSNGSPSGQGVTSSPVSQPQTSRAADIEQSIESPPEIGTAMVVEDSATEDPPVPQVFETTQALAQNSIPLPLIVQPPVAMFPSPGGDPKISTPPQMAELPQFVSPQEIFSPPQFLEAGSLVVTPSYILERSQTSSSSQTLLPSIVHESPITQPVTSHQIVVSPMVPAPPSLVTPSPIDRKSVV